MPLHLRKVRDVARAGVSGPLIQSLPSNIVILVVLPAACLISLAERSSSTKLCLRHKRQQQHVGDVESWAFCAPEHLVWLST